MRPTLFLGLLALLLIPIHHSDAKPSDERVKQTLVGEYQWSNGGDGRLEAEFRPIGEDEWKVKFRFGFNAKEYTWKGTARGSLEEGATVEGTAKWKRRDWRFNGVIENGILKAKHEELQDDGPLLTGTFSLSR